MGITSSTESNSRYDLFTLEKLDNLKEVKLEDLTEKERVFMQGMFGTSLEVWWDGLHALFPATKGDLSTDQPKEEGGTEMDDDDQVFERFSDFMKEGGCKESFSGLVDCLEDTRSLSKCKEHLPILKKCMDARISYYEPILALAKATEDKAIAFIEDFAETNRKVGVTERFSILACGNFAILNKYFIFVLLLATEDKVLAFTQEEIEKEHLAAMKQAQAGGD